MLAFALGLAVNGAGADEAREELAASASVPGLEALFATYDVNGDGVVSWQEAQVDADLASSFEPADRDHNKALTRSEFESAVAIAVTERDWRGPATSAGG
jgi:Ca2+-binding EF-hand superfamily protein